MADGFNRTDRLSSLIQAELGNMLLRDIRDPALERVTITAVKVTRDLSLARVYFLLIGLDGKGGSKADVKRAQAGLHRARGFMRREIGKRVRARTTPELRFIWDESVDNGRRMEELFEEIANEPQPEPEPEAAEESEA